MVHADTGGYKPQNWMTPPTVLEEEPGPDRRAQARRIHRGQLDIRIVEVLSDVTHDMGDAEPLEKDGVERDLQEALAGRAGWCGRGLPARAPRVADGHRARRPHVPRRARTAGSPWRSSAWERSTRWSSCRATWSGSGAIPRCPGCRGVLAAQAVKPQARVLAEARGIAWVEVDLGCLRGRAEPDLTLFAA
jgi:RecB family endonuclease NucS